MVSVQNEDFDVAHEYAALCAKAAKSGAIVTFVGRVRDYGDYKDVETITLEHYPGMTEKMLQNIIDEANEKWAIQAVSIVHRVGELAAGAQIVFVGVASSHRANAFAACEFIMDFLKTKAPFWKKEKTADGQQWVEQKASDLDRIERWTK